MSLFKGCAEGVHRFEARYDEQPIGRLRMGPGEWSPEDIRRLMVVQVYVRDVCRHCGKTIERNTP